MAQQEPLISSITPAACDAVILAGGKATRLQSVVSDRPKILADIGGRPFAHYLLTQLARAGFRRAVFCTGHLADMVENAIGPRWDGLEVVYSREETACDTGGALRLALSRLQAKHCVVVNGDTFLALDFAAMLAQYGSSEAAAAIALVNVDNPGRYGSVSVAPNGLVTGFVEKSAAAKLAGSAPINAGVYVVPREEVAEIPAGQPLSIERDIMPLWVAKGLLAYRCSGPFIDIGTPQSYAEAQDVLALWSGLR